MSVQELINALNKVKDKSKNVIHYNGLPVNETEEYSDEFMLY